MKKHVKADLSLLFVSIIWGSTFVIVKQGISIIPTYNFLAVRFIIAFAICAVVFWKNLKNLDKKTFKYGCIIGVFLFAGYAFQTVGLQYTTASKSGFITGFCVILVPIIESLISKKMPEKENIFGVTFAIIGLGLLTVNGNLKFNIGDFYTLICAFAYALQIIAIGHFTHESDSISLAIVQIGVVAVLCTVFTFAFEKPVMPTGFPVWNAILITGILATALSFVIQNTMQQYTSNTHVALIFTTEPVFSAIFAYFLIGEVLTFKGFIGCVLIIIGMLVSEVDIKAFFTKKLKPARKLAF